MAEFCLECVNKLFSDEVLTEKDVYMSIDFCEECEEWKPCVILVKEKKLHKRIKQYILMLFGPIIVYLYGKRHKNSKTS